jgi:hypothetical protein
MSMPCFDQPDSQDPPQDAAGGSTFRYRSATGDPTHWTTMTRDPSPISHDLIRESAFPRATRLNSPPTGHGTTRPRLARPTQLVSHRGTLRRHSTSHRPHGTAFRPQPDLLHPTTPLRIPWHATIPDLFHPSSPDHFTRVPQHCTAQDATGTGRIGRDIHTRPLAQLPPPRDTPPRRAARHRTAVLFLPPQSQFSSTRLPAGTGGSSRARTGPALLSLDQPDPILLTPRYDTARRGATR